MTPLLLIPFMAVSVPAIPPGRLDAARAVERARYAFVIGATQPFDVAYPRTVFEKRVARELAEERVLEQVFGVRLTPAQLAQEYDRIERTTRAPDQWEAIKVALGRDRRRIEDGFCRPCLSNASCRNGSRSTRGSTRGARRARARPARCWSRAGPAGAARMRLSRRARPSTDDLLKKAREESAGPRCSARPTQRTERAHRLHPEAGALEAQLLRPGDVDGARRTASYLPAHREDGRGVIAEAVTFPKGLREWFQQAAR
jgi:hypothetical protein